METNKLSVQALQKKVPDDLGLAEKYYGILSVINNLRLTQREIQLIAFTAINGNMSYANIREDFCKRYDTTPPTINNIISKLKKVKVLVKDRGKIKVNPVILLKFDSDVTLTIRLINDKLTKSIKETKDV